MTENTLNLTEPDDGDPRPSVALPRDGLPTPVLIGLALLLGLALFLYLNAHRLASQQGTAAPQGKLADAPPALMIPPAPPPPAPIIIQASPSPAAIIPPRPTPNPPPFGKNPMSERMPINSEPAQPILPMGITSPDQLRGGRTNNTGGNGGSGSGALIVDNTSGAGAAVNAAGANSVATNDEAVRATLIRNRGSIIPQGAIIAAVLETPLNSDRPGLARALVSKDARGFDGSRVLIPRGSRLIGEFRGDANPGMRRILVTWNRLIRPDGVAIRINSPVSDSLGGAGVGGKVNTHFFDKFFSAVLQSALTVGVNYATAQIPTGGNNNYYLGIPGQFQQLGQQLVPNVNRPPTVKVREGAQIAVMVARDLDFAGTPPVP